VTGATGTGTRAATAWPSSTRLGLVQWRYQLRSSLRSPVGMFFTIVLPTVMLVLFAVLFGDDTVTTETGEWSIRQFYTGGLAAFTAVSATYTNLVNVVPIRRDEGVLKRWRATPLPTSVYLAGWIAAAVTLAVLGVVLMLGIGVALFDVRLDAAKVPAMVVTFLVGVGAFAALGLAMAAAVPNADSAPAVANATILPLAFVSDVFVAIGDEGPRWLEVIGSIFPLKPFVHAFQDTLNPNVDAPAFAWPELALVAAWGIGGAIVAARTFRWEPSTARPGRRRRGAAADGRT
jgi:ABC-2 type transport system permease protein